MALASSEKSHRTLGGSAPGWPSRDIGTATAAGHMLPIDHNFVRGASGYPRSITKLNQAYHEGLAAAAVPAPKLAAALRSEHRCLQRNLDDDAVRICRMLDVGPTDRTVRAMFALGALPASDLSTFHGLATPTVDDWKAHISFRAQIQDLPPLHLIPGEHRLAIQSDPGVMTALGAGLVVGGSLGERDARRLRNRLLDDIAHVEEPRLAWLVTYTRFAEQSPGVRLTDAQLDYLESFYDSTIRRHADPTDPGRRMRILDYVGERRRVACLLRARPAGLVKRADRRRHCSLARCRP